MDIKGFQILSNSRVANIVIMLYIFQSVVPGPPFAFGAILVIMALLVAIFMPENPHSNLGKSKRNTTVMLEAFHPEAGKEFTV